MHHGSFIIGGAEIYRFSYNALSPLDPDGSFELFPAFEDLFVLSPQGMPFRYPLNPAAWQDESGLKDTTITVPELKKISVHLRLDGAAGKPAAGFQAVPSVGQTYDNWTLGPRRMSQRPADTTLTPPHRPPSENR